MHFAFRWVNNEPCVQIKNIKRTIFHRAFLWRSPSHIDLGIEEK
ncbi:hypothetical protein GMES_3153 [Paraglaciecola mesophila KMM 241]|uniref:Uncharacterized protein n=1 Tax=Paraglaciecola mesophila KMM 241 TaxID=1128912 RepID=K6Z8X6_9ALTE|nr:hypothetical protein GMES_3153 [Paraglaciecola mesophila KMM 241]